MRYSKMLLVDTTYSIPGLCVTPYAGLGYIAEVLEQNGIDYDVLDMGLGYRKGDLLDKVRSFQPDLIGVSMMTMLYKEKYQMITELKDAFRKTDIVAGGPHVSFLKEKVLESCTGIDYGIVSEGEESILELCRNGGGENIKGLIYRNRKGEITYTGKGEYIQDLDALPFPKYRKFDLDRYQVKKIPIVSSRGCVYKCLFCAESLVAGKRFAGRRAENVVDELHYWYERGYRQFDFAEPLFNFDRNRVIEICKGIESAGMNDLTLTCENGIRADRVDAELLERMKRAGFKAIAFGVEGGNDRVLENLRKGETIGQIETAIKDATNVGLNVAIYLLVGTPGETEEDVHDSIALALKYPIFSAQFYNPIPIPGTELFNWVEKNEYFVKSPDEYLNETIMAHGCDPYWETPELTIEARKRLLKLTRNKITRQIRRKALVRELRSRNRIVGRIFSIGVLSHLLMRMINKLTILNPNTFVARKLRKSLIWICGDVFVNPF